MENPYLSTSDSPYNGGGGGGGGFFPHSDLGASDTPNKRRQGGNGSGNTCRSVTIKQVLDSRQDSSADGNSAFTIDNSELSSVMLVGCVRNISQQMLNRSFSIEDGTGTIECKQWSSSNPGGDDMSGASPPIEDSPIRENMYVRVIGAIKQINQRKQVSIFNIQPVMDYNELTFHQLDAIATHLYFTRGGNPAAKDQQSQKAAMGNMTSMAMMNNGRNNAYMPPAAGAVGVNSVNSEFPPVQQAVLDNLRLYDKRPEGVNMRMLVKSVSANNGFPLAAVQEALDTLLNDGHLYGTNDDCCKIAY